MVALFALSLDKEVSAERFFRSIEPIMSKIISEMGFSAESTE